MIRFVFGVTERLICGGLGRMREVCGNRRYDFKLQIFFYYYFYIF